MITAEFSLSHRSNSNYAEIISRLNVYAQSYAVSVKTLSKTFLIARFPNFEAMSKVFDGYDSEWRLRSLVSKPDNSEAAQK